MTLIGNEKFGLESLWLQKSLVLLDRYPDLFSTNRMREARVELIAGTNMLKGIKNWLEAAQLIEKSSRNDCVLSTYGRRILDNDPSVSSSTTWWAIHLCLCFSTRGEPYAGLFGSLNVLSKEFKKFENIVSELTEEFDYAEDSIRTNLQGVRAMFAKGGPMDGLDLVQQRNSRSESVELGFGNPSVPDEVILFALSLARIKNFASRRSVDFKELEEVGLGNYLCLSSSDLRARLRKIEQSQRWQHLFSFTQVANLDSIDFKSEFSDEKSLIILLQSKKETWV